MRLTEVTKHYMERVSVGEDTDTQGFSVTFRYDEFTHLTTTVLYAPRAIQFSSEMELNQFIAALEGDK